MRYENYAWRGGREAVLRFGPDRGTTLLVMQPLFEEANRTRRTLVEVMRILGNEFGISSALPDLPGTGDSMVPTVEVRFDDWAEAIAACGAALPQPVLTLSIRGGALLDRFAGTAHRWRLSPQSGQRLLRDMLRSTALSSDFKVTEIEEQARATPTMLAGNLLHPDLFAALHDAEPDTGVSTRTVGIAGEAGTFDYEIAAVPLWRRAEPGEDPQLVAALTDELLSWVNRCVAS